MMHSWDDDNEEYEILGLRKLLREAVAPEVYAGATRENCIVLGVEEHQRLSAEANRRWHQTYADLTSQLGRAPSVSEHAAAIRALK